MGVLVLDGDDTLWMTEWQYSEAFANFFSAIYRILGGRSPVPSLHYLKDHIFEVDKALFPTWGIRRGRVAESMATTYRDVCAYIKRRYEADLYTAADEEEVRRIGDQPFDFTRTTWIDGAEDMLCEIKKRGHTPCLLSSYDPGVFPARAAFLGVHRFFEPARVLAVEGKKTGEHFKAVSGWPLADLSGKKEYWAVGNGEIDIRPALELSDDWKGLYVPHGSTSAFFQKDGQIDRFSPPPFEHPRVTTLGTIHEVLTHI